MTQTPPVAAPTYEGLVTRAIAFAIDAAIIDLIALVVGVGVGLALSILNVGHNTQVVLLAIGGVAFVVWSIAYFVTFWSTRRSIACSTARSSGWSSTRLPRARPSPRRSGARA